MEQSYQPRKADAETKTRISRIRTKETPKGGRAGLRASWRKRCCFETDNERGAMNHELKPAPSKHYQERQQELWRLLEVPGGSTLNAAQSLQEELEAEFVDAWGFSWASEEVTQDIRVMLTRNCNGFLHCFDHCNCYYEGETESRVVVTQPYYEAGEVVESLTHSLVVPGQVEPGIIAAPEWAFYYPKHATLIVVKCSPAYERVLWTLDRLWSPAAQACLGKN